MKSNDELECVCGLIEHAYEDISLCKAADIKRRTTALIGPNLTLAESHERGRLSIA